MPHNAVGSIKAGYQQSPTAYKTSYYHLFSLEAGSLFWVSQTFLSSSILTGHEWQANQRGVDENYNKTATLFDAQNAGNDISELLNFKFFSRGTFPETQQRKRVLMALSLGTDT